MGKCLVHSTIRFVSGGRSSPSSCDLPSFLSFLPPFSPSLPPGKEKVGSTEAGEMIDDEFGEAKLGSWNPFLSLPLTTCKEGLEGKRKKTPSL